MTGFREDGAPGALLLFGGSGLLGRALRPELTRLGWRVTAPTRGEVDVREGGAVRRAVATWMEEGGDSPTRQVVNLAAFTDVNGAERRPREAFALNRDGAGEVAEAAADAHVPHLFLSTDYVFDGRARTPYPPSAPTSPLSVYGRSKAEGEERVLAAPGGVVVRTSWLYGAGGRNFVDTVVAKGWGVVAGKEPGPLRVVDDQRGRPTWTESLARGVAALLPVMTRFGRGGSEVGPILHLADGGDATWWELATAALELAGVADAAGEPLRVERTRTRSEPGVAARPAYSVLELGATVELLGADLPHWRESLARYLGGSPTHAGEGPSRAVT